MYVTPVTSTHLCHLSDPVEALEEGVAVILETTVSKLDGQPSSWVREAIGAVVAMWQKVLGGLVGPDCALNILDPAAEGAG